MMNNKLKKFLRAIKIITGRQEIKTIDELLDLYNHPEAPFFRRVHHADLSNLDLSDHPELFTGALPKTFMTAADASKSGIILDWTDDVTWPSADKLPRGINPSQILESAKHPTEMTGLHARGKTGRGISIAIIDQGLNTTHPEYADNIAHYEVIDTPFLSQHRIEYHGSLVAGCAVGHETGTAPNAKLYYFAAPGRDKTDDGKYIPSRKYYIAAIRKILDINKRLPENQKIRFLSCSWGTKSDILCSECDEMFAECERNGIMVIGGAYHNLGTFPCDKRYQNKTNYVGIPTDGKTTSFWRGGYKYTRQGGSSSTFPYLAGVYACALQDNQIFCTRPNWITEINDIMQRTATESENGGKIINPVAIVDAVSQIAREMEAQIIKQQSTQHE